MMYTSWAPVAGHSFSSPRDKVSFPLLLLLSWTIHSVYPPLLSQLIFIRHFLHDQPSPYTVLIHLNDHHAYTHININAHTRHSCSAVAYSNAFEFRNLKMCVHCSILSLLISFRSPPLLSGVSPLRCGKGATES